jgi:hypothetical protein
MPGSPICAKAVCLTCSPPSATDSMACRTWWGTCCRRRSCTTWTIHFIRDTVGFASRGDSDALRRDVKPICTAVNAAARERSTSTPSGGQRHPAHFRLSDHASDELMPFWTATSRSAGWCVFSEHDRAPERPVPASDQRPAMTPSEASGRRSSQRLPPPKWLRDLGTCVQRLMRTRNQTHRWVRLVRGSSGGARPMCR